MTYEELAAQGCAVTVESAGLTSPRARVRCPPALGPLVSDAIAWRVTAMRAQHVRTMGDPRVTLCAVLAPPQEHGLCCSCGEPLPTRGEGGDCRLCAAARVAALRAEGVLGVSETLPVPQVPTVDEWRASLGWRPYPRA